MWKAMNKLSQDMSLEYGNRGMQGRSNKQFSYGSKKKVHTTFPSLVSFMQAYPGYCVGVMLPSALLSVMPGEMEQNGGLGLGGRPESGLSNNPSRFLSFKLSSIPCKFRCPTMSGRASVNSQENLIQSRFISSTRWIHRSDAILGSSHCAHADHPQIRPQVKNK